MDGENNPVTPPPPQSQTDKPVLTEADIVGGGRQGLVLNPFSTCRYESPAKSKLHGDVRHPSCETHMPLSHSKAFLSHIIRG